MYTRGLSQAVVEWVRQATHSMETKHGKDPAKWVRSAETLAFPPLLARVKDYVSIAIALFYACTVLKNKTRLPNWELVVDSACLSSKDLLYRGTVAPFVENS